MKRWMFAAAAGVLIGFGSTAAADKMTFQSVAAHDFDTGEELNGAGLMWRTRHAIWANLSLTDLDPSHGYTVWWVVFNNADECIEEPDLPGDPACGAADLVPAVDPAIFYAGGFISDANGTANGSFHLMAGDVPQGVDVLIEGAPAGGGDGLNEGNGFGAEVHIIARSHEPISDGEVDEQIGTFAGLCGGAPDFPDCEDQQAVAFRPNPPQ